MKCIRARLLVITGCLVYIAIFRWSYAHAVVPLFGYMGYRFDPLPLPHNLITWLFAITPAVWMPIAVRRPSQVISWMLYLLVVVPIAIIPFHVVPDRAEDLILFNGSIALSFAALCAVGHVPRARLALPRLNPATHRTLTYVVWMLVHAYILRSFDFHPIPRLSDVYDIRLEYRDSLIESGRLVGYLMAWTANVLNPVLIGTGLIARKWFPVVLGILGQILIFSVTGFKSVFFSSVLLVALYLLLHCWRTHYGIVLAWGFSAFVLVVTVLSSLTQSHALVSLFVRRLIATAGLLTGFYFDFFSSNQKAMLGHSFLEPFVSYQYDVSPPFLIGYYYLHDSQVSANANLWADAYANFGFIGIFLFTSILFLLAWLYDCVTVPLDLRFASLAIAIPSWSLTNSALLTSLVTHGFLFALVVMCFAPAMHPREWSPPATHCKRLSRSWMRRK